MLTVFGSARLCEPADEYRLARLLGAALAGCGLTIMTGGGPGLMEAVSRERESPVAARGLPDPSLGRTAGQYPPRSRGDFPLLFRRKVMMVRNARGFVALPGGWDTGRIVRSVDFDADEETGRTSHCLPGNRLLAPVADFIQGMDNAER